MKDADPKAPFAIDEIEESLKKYLFDKGRELSGNFHLGKVINNNDPEKLGRCQILIYGYYDGGGGIPNSDLPWAIPTFGFNGEFCVPPNGAIVNCYFMNGDVFNPHYTTKAIDKAAISTHRDEDYPNTFVIYDDGAGTYKVINKKRNESRENYISGLELSVDSKGNYTINANSTQTGEITLIGKAGTIKIGSDGKISIGDGSESSNPLNGVVNGNGVDPLTGLNYYLLGSASAKVFTKS